MLTKTEIHKVTYSYIGVEGGYLGDFSYKTHREFYPYFCELDISPDAYDGTTRIRFMTILEKADASTQAKILRGVINKYPVSYFPEDIRKAKCKTLNEIESLIRRLEGQAIHLEQPIITNEVVERAIKDAEILLKSNGATSAIDRIHTVLHAYLKEVCKQEGIELIKDENLTQTFKKLKSEHPKLQLVGYKQNEIDLIMNAFSNVLDKLNPIRNHASLTHPNPELLGEDESFLVVDSARTILNYLNRKLK